MISIIVCSVDDYRFESISKSVEDTIGGHYEIIKIENNKEPLSISRAYNKGALQAKFNYLVFVHEDVIFHTLDWGEKLIKHFQTLTNPGVLGIAGSNYLPVSPTDWWIPDSKRRFFNFLDNNKKGIIGSGIPRNSETTEAKPVYLLDGMFLAIKKSTFQKIKFDEELDGFHGYDTSICLRASINYINYFIPEILIEHFSPGNPNKTWIENTILAFRKFDRPRLKLSIDPKLEEKSFHLFLNNLKKLEPNWARRRRESLFFLKRVLKEFISLRSIGLWIWHQIIFIKDSFCQRNNI